MNAIVLSIQSASSAALGRLRKSYPDLPVVVCGPRNGSRPSLRSVLYLERLPAPADFLTLITESKKRVEDSRRVTKLSRRLRETSKRLQILSEIVSTANSILEPDRVISVIMSQIQTLIPSDAWSILLVEPETGDLTFTRALGEKGYDLEETRVKKGEGIAGWVAETGEPAIVNDVRRDERFQQRFDEKTAFNTRAVLCAPLISRGRTIGVVEIINPEGRERFSKRDLNLLLTLVEPAAIALENALLFQKTQNLTVTDDLTRLYNSRFLDTYLSDSIGLAAEHSGALAVAFLDLDGFKSVNDSHGHLCGSRCLVEVASLIRRSVRDTDMAARYGGDEFVVVLPDTGEEGARQVAERIRAAIERHVFLRKMRVEARLTASIGVSVFPQHGTAPQDLIQKADQAMYIVKEEGKNAVGFAL